MEKQELIELEGIVNEIKYTNEENGYTICNVEVDDENVVFVGTMPFLSVGEQVTAGGEFVVHKTFGEQFKVEYYERSLPTTVASMVKFLSSGGIKGVGQKTAAKIVSRFGADTFDVIEYDYKKLSEITGINLKKAEDIHIAFLEHTILSSIIEFLIGYDITPLEALAIYNIYRGETIARIKENPYVICSDPMDISFERADVIANDFVVENRSDFRSSAGIKHIIRHNYRNGHTYLPRDILTDVAIRLLQEDREFVENTIEELMVKGELICYATGGIERMYLPQMFTQELNVANKLALMDKFSSPIRSDDREIDGIEKSLGIEYEENQRRAIKQSLKRGVFVLTGGPGTGKTTVIKGIIELLKNEGKKFVLCAPTGRAAKRMTELTGVESKTIHRLLKLDFSAKIPQFVHNDQNPLKVDCVIVDECSMIDVPLMDALLSAIKVGSKIILVGDSDQLPSIGAGNVLKDIIESDCIDKTELAEIFRQAKESLIVVNSHMVNRGEYPDLQTKNNDFFFLKCENVEQLPDLLVSLCRDRLPKAYKIDGIRDLQVITPTRIKESGTILLNKALQLALNPPSHDKKEIRFRDGIFRENDKVMQTKNNYMVEWHTDEDEIGTGIFNGDIGDIYKIDTLSQLVYIKFDDKKVCYPIEMLTELDLAYAMTVHKSQGSEFPMVIFVAEQSGKKLTTRNLLYTALTRAKNMIVIVGNENAIYKMVDNGDQTKRYSGLKDMLVDTIINEEN